MKSLLALAVMLLAAMDAAAGCGGSVSRPGLRLLPRLKSVALRPLAVVRPRFNPPAAFVPRAIVVPASIPKQMPGPPVRSTAPAQAPPVKVTVTVTVVETSFDPLTGCTIQRMSDGTIRKTKCLLRR